MIKFFERNYKFSLIITILIAVTIFYLSTLTFKGEKVSTGILSYIYHFFAFFFFTGFLLISLTKGKKKNLILISILIGILYGISDEIHQLFVPFRYFSYFDILLNSIGVIFAGFFYTLSLRIRKKL